MTQDQAMQIDKVNLAKRKLEDDLQETRPAQENETKVYNMGEVATITVFNAMEWFHKFHNGEPGELKFYPRDIMTPMFREK